MDDKLREREIKKNIEYIQKIDMLCNNETKLITQRLGAIEQTAITLLDDALDRLDILISDFNRKSVTDLYDTAETIKLVKRAYELQKDTKNFDLQEEIRQCTSFDKLEQLIKRIEKQKEQATSLIDMCTIVKQESFYIGKYIDAYQVVGYGSVLDELKRTSCVTKDNFNSAIALCKKMSLSHPRFFKLEVYEEEYKELLKQYDGIVFRCTVKQDYSNNRFIEYGGSLITPKESISRLVYKAKYVNDVENLTLIFDAR